MFRENVTGLRKVTQTPPKIKRKNEGKKRKRERIIEKLIKVKKKKYRTSIRKEGK